MTVSLCIKVVVYRFNGALRNTFESYSTNNTSVCLLCGLEVVCVRVLREQPFALLLWSYSHLGTLVTCDRRVAHGSSWSPQCTEFNPPPSTPPSSPPSPAVLPLLLSSLLSFSFDGSVNTDTESISLLAIRCHLYRDINSESY